MPTELVGHRHRLAACESKTSTATRHDDHVTHGAASFAKERDRSDPTGP
jgi:hypothetical protein